MEPDQHLLAVRLPRYKTFTSMTSPKKNKRQERGTGMGQWLTLMESDGEQDSVSEDKKLTELSHASNFSKSTSSRVYRGDRSKQAFWAGFSGIYIYIMSIILILILAALLPAFWFGHFPPISKELRKIKSYRVPVIIIVECVLFVACILCLWKTCQKLAALRIKSTSVSTASVSQEFRDPDSYLSNTLQSSGAFDYTSQSLTTSPSHPPNTSVRLREILEELPPETVKQIHFLAYDFLQPGNGKATVVTASTAQLRNSINYRIEGIQGSKCHKLAVKLLILGEPNVGKTSIFHRILYDMFTESYLQTVGTELGFITLYMSSKNKSDQLSVSVQIWDIAGDDKFSKSNQVYFKDAIIALTVCDISNRDSLQSLKWWISEMNSKVYDPSIVLFLTKDDIQEKEITSSDIDQIDELAGVDKYAVSARTGDNVMDAFMDVIAKTILKETRKFL